MDTMTKATAKTRDKRASKATSARGYPADYSVPEAILRVLHAQHFSNRIPVTVAFVAVHAPLPTNLAAQARSEGSLEIGIRVELERLRRAGQVIVDRKSNTCYITERGIHSIAPRLGRSR